MTGGRTAHSSRAEEEEERREIKLGQAKIFHWMIWTAKLNEA